MQSGGSRITAGVNVKAAGKLGFNTLPSTHLHNWLGNPHKLMSMKSKSDFTYKFTYCTHRVAAPLLDLQSYKRLSSQTQKSPSLST